MTKTVQLLLMMLLLANTGCDTDYYTTRYAGQLNCSADSDNAAWTYGVTVQLHSRTVNSWTTSRTEDTGFTIDIDAPPYIEVYRGTVQNGVLVSTHVGKQTGEDDFVNIIPNLTLTNSLLNHFQVGGQGGIPFTAVHNAWYQNQYSEGATQPCEIEIF